MATRLGFAALAMLLHVVHSECGLSIDNMIATQGSSVEGTKAMVTPTAAPADASAEDEKVSVAPLLHFIAIYIMRNFPGYVASHPCIQRIADDCGWMLSYKRVKTAISKCS